MKNEVLVILPKGIAPIGPIKIEDTKVEGQKAKEALKEIFKTHFQLKHPIKQ